LKKLCEENNIKLRTIIGLGATNNAKVGLYNTEEKSIAQKSLLATMKLPTCMETFQQ